MFFGRSKSSSKFNGADDVGVSNHENVGNKSNIAEDEWFLLWQNQATISSEKKREVEEHFEVVDDCYGNTHNLGGELFYDNDINPPTVLRRHEMALQRVENMLTNGRIPTENWKRFVLIIILGGMIAKHSILYTSTEKNNFDQDVIRIHPPLTTTKATSAVQPDSHRCRTDYSPSVAAQSKEIMSATSVVAADNFERHPAYAESVFAQAPKESPESLVLLQPDCASFLAEEQAQGMKSSHRIRLQPSSSADDSNGTLSYFKERVAELEAINEEYLKRVTRMSIESDTWKFLLQDCNQQLKQMTQKVYELERELHRTKRSVAVSATFATAAYPFGTANRQPKMPMASATGIFQNNSTMLNLVGTLKVPSIQSDWHCHNSLIPVGPTALIPSPA